MLARSWLSRKLSALCHHAGPTGWDRLYAGAFSLLVAGHFLSPTYAAPLVLAPDEVRVNVGFSSENDARRIRPILIEEHGANIVRHLDRIHVTTVVVSRSELERLRRSPRIRASADFVRLDGRVWLPEQMVPRSFTLASDRPSSTSIPDDPYYPEQWGPPCLEMESVWNRIGFDMRPVKIAIIDTGVDMDHPDLDGHIDTVNDWDFVNSDDDADDDHGHGTHCAGIAVAETNNGTGGAGILNAVVLPIKVLGPQGWGYSSDVAAGISHAVERGASVISLSLGGSYDASIDRAAEDAWNAGRLVFAAAGNHGTDLKNYPSSLTSVIGVGALEECNALASWSARGFGNHEEEGNVEVAAPGVEIFSTFFGGRYAYLSGTSMACPHAAAVGLGYRVVVPDWTAAQVRAHIQENADPLGSRNDFGYGRIDTTPGNDEIFCPSLESEWTLEYEWDGTSIIHFYADHTFQAGAYSGTWSQDECTVDWVYDSGTHYWGVMENGGQYMSGNMTSWYGGWTGTWSAVRN